jgi:hypothetical protein
LNDKTFSVVGILSTTLPTHYNLFTHSKIPMASVQLLRQVT